MLHIWFNQTWYQSCRSHWFFLLLYVLKLFSYISTCYNWNCFAFEKYIFKAKSFSINLSTASEPQSSRIAFYLFILSLVLPLSLSLSPCKVKVSKRQPDGRDLKQKNKEAWRRMMLTRMARKMLEPRANKSSDNVVGSKLRAFYVDFICNSRESRNLHKQIEFCIHFLYPRIPNKT